MKKVFPSVKKDFCGKAVLKMERQMRKRLRIGSTSLFDNRLCFNVSNENF